MWKALCREMVVNKPDRATQGDQELQFIQDFLSVSRGSPASPKLVKHRQARTVGHPTRA